MRMTIPQGSDSNLFIPERRLQNNLRHKCYFYSDVVPVSSPFTTPRPIDPPSRTVSQDLLSQPVTLDVLETDEELEQQQDTSEGQESAVSDAEEETMAPTTPTSRSIKGCRLYTAYRYLVHIPSLYVYQCVSAPFRNYAKYQRDHSGPLGTTDTHTALLLRSESRHRLELQLPAVADVGDDPSSPLTVSQEPFQDPSIRPFPSGKPTLYRKPIGGPRVPEGGQLDEEDENDALVELGWEWDAERPWDRRTYSYW